MILLGRIAIKVPRLQHWRDGRRCNWVEAQRSPRDCRLCPVLHCWLGGAVVVMERADALNQTEYEQLDAAGEIDALTDYWNPVTGRLVSLCMEPKAANIGRTCDGRLVIIDYGDEEEVVPDEGPPIPDTRPAS